MCTPSYTGPGPISGSFTVSSSMIIVVRSAEAGGGIGGDVMGDVRNLLLQPVGPQKVTGTVAFRDCKFINCRFLRVGFTGSPAFLAELEQVLGGATQ